MLKLGIVQILIFLSLAVHASADLINKYDQNQYSPAKYGLKDLAFEIRVENLDKELKERMALDKISDPHFQVYWMAPGRVSIEVIGLPPGFESLKNDLKKLVIERLEYVVPQDMSSRLRAYDFEAKEVSANGTLLKGLDKTHSNAISEIQLVFNSDSSLRSMKTFSPSGTQMAKFESGAKSWSHSKNVVSRVSLEGISGIQKTQVETSIDYLAKDGFGFPEEIASVTTVTAMTNQKGANETTMSSKVYFSNYKVNSGDAKKHFMEQDAP